MGKKIILLSGVSGTGKTHARLTDSELKDLPHLDIADIYRDCPVLDWYSALLALLRQIRDAFEHHDTIVVEGYFMPGTPSQRILLDDMRVMGAQVEIRYFWAPLELCQERIVRQWERGEISNRECGRRIELLKRCWKAQE